jgi:hypothetical protein
MLTFKRITDYVGMYRGEKYLILDGCQHIEIQNAVLSEHPFLKGNR